jgi:hypothetical protein
LVKLLKTEIPESRDFENRGESDTKNKNEGSGIQG